MMFDPNSAPAPMYPNPIQYSSNKYIIVTNYQNIKFSFLNHDQKPFGHKPLNNYKHLDHLPNRNNVC